MNRAQRRKDAREERRRYTRLVGYARMGSKRAQGLLASYNKGAAFWAGVAAELADLPEDAPLKIAFAALAQQGKVTQEEVERLFEEFGTDPEEEQSDEVSQ